MSNILANDGVTANGRSARQNFIAAFHLLAKESNVDSIPIQKICDRAGYCRKHYYNLFNNKRELVELSVWDDLDIVARNCEFPTLKKLVWHADIIDDEELSRVVNRFVEYYRENPSYFRNILESSEVPLLQSVHYNFISQFFVSLTSSLHAKANGIILDDYLPSMMAHGLLSVTMEVLECCAYERDLEIPWSNLWVEGRTMVRSLAANRLADAVSVSIAHRNMTHIYEFPQAIVS